MWDRKAFDIGCKCHYIQDLPRSEKNSDKHNEPAACWVRRPGTLSSWCRWSAWCCPRSSFWDVLVLLLLVQLVCSVQCLGRGCWSLRKWTPPTPGECSRRWRCLGCCWLLGQQDVGLLETDGVTTLATSVCKEADESLCAVKAASLLSDV